MIRNIALLTLIAFAACAEMEEPMMEAPIVVEPETAMDVIDCDGDEDGIGGTGCEPDQVMTRKMIGY